MGERMPQSNNHQPATVSPSSSLEKPRRVPEMRRESRRITGQSQPAAMSAPINPQFPRFGSPVSSILTLDSSHGSRNSAAVMQNAQPRNGVETKSQYHEAYPLTSKDGIIMDDIKCSEIYHPRPQPTVLTPWINLKSMQRCSSHYTAQNRGQDPQHGYDIPQTFQGGRDLIGNSHISGQFASRKLQDSTDTIDREYSNIVAAEEFKRKKLLQVPRASSKEDLYRYGKAQHPAVVQQPPQSRTVGQQFESYPNYSHDPCYLQRSPRALEESGQIQDSSLMEHKPKRKCLSWLLGASLLFVVVFCLLSGLAALILVILVIVNPRMLFRQTKWIFAGSQPSISIHKRLIGFAFWEC